MNIADTSFKLTADEAQVSGLPATIPQTHALIVAFSLARRFERLRAEYEQVCTATALDELPVAADLMRDQMQAVHQLAEAIAASVPECDLLRDVTAYCARWTEQSSAPTSTKQPHDNKPVAVEFEKGEELRLPSPSELSTSTV